MLLIQDIHLEVAARPRCTICEKELIHTAIATSDGKVYKVWICDCEDQPDGIAKHIVNAREWDDATLIVT